MKDNEKYIKKSIKEIFDLSALLLDFCKHNLYTSELDCLCTGMNVLYKKADELNAKVMETE